MKGSPAKLGSIQGTTGHASALKMADSPAKHEPWTKAHKEKVAHSGSPEAHNASPAKINLIKMGVKKIVKKVGKIMPKKGAAPAEGAAPAGAAPATPAIEPKGVSAPAPTKMYKKSPAKGADPDSFLGVMEASSKGKLDPAPTKFWATVAKVAIGANKKRNAQKQARDDAKNKGVQDAMSKGPSKF